MAAKKAENVIKEIRKGLLDQLKELNANKPHFRDLVEDYMNFFDVKSKLIDDIKDRGVVYIDVSSVGVAMQKNNPSVKELTSVNRQMLAILRELGIKTDKITAVGVDDCDL